MARNGRFACGGKSVDVYVTKFWYTWRLNTKGTSQARQKQTIYPFRMEQSSLNVELQFPTVDEYRAFGEFARWYHLLVTQASGLVGSSVPKMIFTSSAIPKMGYGSDIIGTIKYSVALPSVPMTFSVDSVAPTMTLELHILEDMSGDLATESVTEGSFSAMFSPSVNSSNSSGTPKKTGASDVKNGGDAAFFASRLSSMFEGIFGK